MAIRAQEPVADRAGTVSVGGVEVRPRRSRVLRQEGRLVYALLTPTLLVILFVVAYPFCSAVYLSLQNKMVGSPGRWVGFANYVELFHDDVFLRTAWNSVVYTVVAVALKFVLGLTMETGVPVSYAGSPTPAAGEVLNTHVIPKMIQRVLVENWDAAKALDECHKKISEIYVRHAKG